MADPNPAPANESKTEDEKEAAAAASSGAAGAPPLPASKSMPRVGFASSPAGPSAQGTKRAAVLIKVMEEMQATAGPDASAQLGKIGLELVVQKLVEGGVFKKHSVNKMGREVGNWRLVWCSADLRELQWSDLDRKKVSQSLQTSELSGVGLGAESEVLKPLREAKRVRPERCLTLTFASRTLDLECTSQFDRDIWFLAFNHLLSYGRMAPADQQESAVSLARRNLRGLQTTTLAAEIETLKDQLAEAQTHVGRLQSALRKVKSDTTGEELLHPKLYRDRTQEEVQRLRQNLASAKAEANFYREDNRRVKQESAKAAAELAMIRQLQERADGSMASAEREQFEHEKAALKKELDLAVVREGIKTTAGREQFVAAATSVPLLEVPVSMLPAPAPEDEYSSSDDEDLAESEDVLALSAAERAARLRRKAMADLFSCAVHINQKEVECPRSEDRVDFYTDRVLAEVAAAAGRRPGKAKLGAAAAKAVFEAVLRGVSETQVEGDAYGATNWVAGHPELVVVVPNNSAPRTLFFEADESGLLMLSRHHFFLNDARAAMSAGTSQDRDLVWLNCTAAYTRKAGYERQEIIAPQVLLSFHTGKPRTPEEARLADQKAAAEPAVASSLLTRQMHEEAKTLSEEDLQKVRARERERVAEANAGARREDGLFCIDDGWLASWKQFLAGGPRPGPVDNAGLFEGGDAASGKVREGLKPGRDYRALPRALWDTLIDMYGGGPAIPRKGPNIYKE